LIVYNGELVESLYATPVYKEIISFLIQEGIESVSGKTSNGRYYYGADIKDKDDLQFLRGYKKALMDFNNYLNDFVVAKNNLEKDRKTEELERKAPMYNPFLEEE